MKYTLILLAVALVGCSGDDAPNAADHSGSGVKLQGTFTVKAHELYNGTAQTVLQRPRHLSVTTPEVSE